MMKRLAQVLVLLLMSGVVIAWEEVIETTDVERDQLKGPVMRVITIGVPEFYYDKDNKQVANSGPYTTKGVVGYDPRGRKVYDSFYATHNPQDRDMGRDRYTNIEYDANGRMIKSVTSDAKEAVITESKVWDKGTGRLKQHLSISLQPEYNFNKLYLYPGDKPKGNLRDYTAIYQYDENERLYQACIYADTTKYSYSKKGNKVNVTECRAGDCRKTTVEKYNRMHLLTGQMVYYHSTPVSITSYKYNSDGKETVMAYERLYTEPGNTKFNPYDDKGHIVNYFPSDSGSAASRITEYDGHGNPTSVLVSIVTGKDKYSYFTRYTYTYGINGNILTRITTDTELQKKGATITDTYKYDSHDNWTVHTTYYNTQQTNLVRRGIFYY